jgi:hypothetical protein
VPAQPRQMVDHYFIDQPNLTIDQWLRRRRDEGWVPVGEPTALVHDRRVAMEYRFEQMDRGPLHLVRRPDE